MTTTNLEWQETISRGVVASLMSNFTRVPDAIAEIIGTAGIASHRLPLTPSLIPFQLPLQLNQPLYLSSNPLPFLESELLSPQSTTQKTQLPRYERLQVLQFRITESWSMYHFIAKWYHIARKRNWTQIKRSGSVRSQESKNIDAVEVKFIG